MLTQAVLEKDYFESLKKKAFASLAGQEHLFLNLSAEQSQFLRVNGARVRQTGTVEDATLEITLVLEKDGGLRKASHSITLNGLIYEDSDKLQTALKRLRAEAAELPADPFAELPQNRGSSSQEKKGKLLPIQEAAEALLAPVQGVDVAGIYASGPMVRAMANSAGQTHWFATESGSFDYSIYTPSQRAVKGTYAGMEWDRARYLEEMESSKEKVALLERPSKKVERGNYRTYLAPASVAELVTLYSWGGMSEASIRQGDSALRLVRSGERQFSPKFSLIEDFSAGTVPRFNSEGETTPEVLPLIQNGKFVNSLVSLRSSKEYGVASNGALSSETLRAPSIAAGSLAEKDVLQRLGTGLYLSNLHYLNWSDQPGGRITGMTRFACFWVENGKIQAPIENLRFDDTIFSLFGDALEDFTQERSFHPEVGTYYARHVGGMWTPGMLLKEMTFTL